MKTIKEIAQRLRDAQANAEAIAPLRDTIGVDNIESAYKIQQLNVDYGLKQGRVLCGRKIGLTSQAVQNQLGVDQPDYGALFLDMAVDEITEIDTRTLIQPKIEAEVVLVIGKDLPERNITMSELLTVIDYVLPALEIVDSRIQNWDIKITDTIADNASCGLFVLGTQKTKLEKLDLRLCGMVMEHRGEPVSVGAGAACMGNPLNAALWLANKMASNGTPLKAGEIILTGALGAMVKVNAGDKFEARIAHLGSVSARFAA